MKLYSCKYTHAPQLLPRIKENIGLKILNTWVIVKVKKRDHEIHCRDNPIDTSFFNMKKIVWVGYGDEAVDWIQASGFMAYYYSRVTDNLSDVIHNHISKMIHKDK